jgi:hypothetical protein
MCCLVSMCLNIFCSFFCCCFLVLLYYGLIEYMGLFNLYLLSHVLCPKISILEKVPWAVQGEPVGCLLLSCFHYRNFSSLCTGRCVLLQGALQPVD